VVGEPVGAGFEVVGVGELVSVCVDVVELLCVVAAAGMFTVVGWLVVVVAPSIACFGASLVLAGLRARCCTFMLGWCAAATATMLSAKAGATTTAAIIRVCLGNLILTYGTPIVWYIKLLA
jgi:hypothetical protein